MEAKLMTGMPRIAQRRSEIGFENEIAPSPPVDAEGFELENERVSANHSLAFGIEASITTTTMLAGFTDYRLDRHVSDQLTSRWF
jgi:hypothetical protein